MIKSKLKSDQKDKGVVGLNETDIKNINETLISKVEEMGGEFEKSLN